MRKLINRINPLDFVIYFLIVILCGVIVSRLYSRISKPSVESKTLGVLKINKICMDLPSGITECVEGPSANVYKILTIQDPDNADISTIYLKAK